MTNPEDTENIVLTFECDGTPDVEWVVQTSTFTEGLNEPFNLLVNLATENLDAEPVQLLGQPAKLTITRGAFMRQVMGMVSEVQEGSTNPEMVTTNIVVEPALEALRHRVNTKIFQDKTVPDILEEVLNEGLGAYDRSIELRLSRTYPTCEYRTQYTESDLSFCHRLMQEEGIVYWFEFDGDTELLVLADAPDKYLTIESIHGATCTFTLNEGQVEGHEYISVFHMQSRVRPTKVVTRHFDWTHPSVLIEGDSQDSDPGPGDTPNGAYVDPEREVYEQDEQELTLHEYDGEAYGANDVDDQARLRREATAFEARVGRGISTITSMTAGGIFEMIGHSQSDLDGKYLVLSVTHSFENFGLHYENGIECIPESVIYRPKRVTPKPRISSIQTAIVVGPAGEEIHTDNHGRIKVQFHWDRLGASDEHSSCWVRVMQPWAGAGWGFVFIPRMGMEVIVRFVNGDPDQPVVIGSVYNAEHPPPYALPDEKTKSTIKTESSLGGGGFNEIRFEDLAGEEEIFTHAQKDQNEVVENDHTTTVHHDQTIVVDNNQSQDVGVDQTEHIGSNQDLTVDANRTIAVHGNFTETIDGSETRTVSSGVTETIDSGETRTVTGGMTETITGDRTQSISGSSTETITGSLTQTITGGATITTPAAYEINAAGGVTIIAPGGSTILSPGGHKLIAAGGQHTVDQDFLKTGAKWNDSFAMSASMVGIKIETCLGMAVTFTATKVELNMILKASHIGATCAFVGNQLKKIDALKKKKDLTNFRGSGVDIHL